jgi:hypothetical protein
VENSARLLPSSGIAKIWPEMKVFGLFALPGGELYQMNNIYKFEPPAVNE